MQNMPRVKEIKERYAFLDDGGRQIHDALHKIDAILTGPMMALVKSPIAEYYQRAAWEQLMDAFGQFQQAAYVALDLCHVQYHRELREAEAIEEIEIEKGEKA